VRQGTTRAIKTTTAENGSFAAAPEPYLHNTLSIVALKASIIVLMPPWFLVFVGDKKTVPGPRTLRKSELHFSCTNLHRAVQANQSFEIPGSHSHRGRALRVQPTLPVSTSLRRSAEASPSTKIVSFEHPSYVPLNRSVELPSILHLTLFSLKNDGSELIPVLTKRVSEVRVVARRKRNA